MQGEPEPVVIDNIMREHGIRRIERHEPTAELPYEWFAVELEDGFLAAHLGTGKTVDEAFAKALHNTRGKVAA